MQEFINFNEEVLVRLEAVKSAAKVSSPSGSIGNLLIHADWLASYILTGKPPEIAPASISPVAPHHEERDSGSSFLSYPGQSRTGRRGYFGYLGSVAAHWHW
jgi:hypothetical protein